MKTLSIQQPWAWAILHGGKDIENRDWPTQVRGRVLIHVGKKFDKDECDYINGVFGVTVPTDLQTGGIVGSVEIVDCVKQSKSKWFFGRFGFVLRNPIVLPFMPCRGQLGFFEVEYKTPEDGALEASEGKFTTANSASLPNAQLALDL